MKHINIGRTIKQIESSNAKKHDDIIRATWKRVPFPIQEIVSPVILLLWLPYILLTFTFFFMPNILLTYLIEYEHKRDDKGNKIKC